MLGPGLLSVDEGLNVLNVNIEVSPYTMIPLVILRSLSDLGTMDRAGKGSSPNTRSRPVHEVRDTDELRPDRGLTGLIWVS